MRRLAAVVGLALGLTMAGSGPAQAGASDLFAGARVAMKCDIVKYVDGHRSLADCYYRNY